MYVYYEHHKDANGKVVLTELRLSSYSDGSLFIRFKNPIENMVFESCKPLLKWPPLQYYSYEPPLKIWSYFGQYGISSTYGEEVIKKLETVVKALNSPFKAIAVEDLSGQAVNNHVDLSGKRLPKMSAEEFFYNRGTTVTQAKITREEIEKKLRELTGFSYVDKKAYRQAALIFHPDRNHGDGSKMSELNMLWQLWNNFEKEKEVTHAI